MSDNSTNFSGNIPEEYDRGLGPVIFIDYAAEMANRVAAARPNRVLETAAGTGIVTRNLRDRIPESASLVATDLNLPMLTVAQRKFHAHEQVDFRQSDATDLPFQDGTFDAVVCQFGMMFFPDKEKGYREAYRVLASGGRYLFSVWDSHLYNPYARLVHETVGAFFPYDPPQFYRVPFSYQALEPIKTSLMDAGFAPVRIDILPIRKAHVDFGAFARGLIFGNPLFDQIRARGGADPDRVAEAVSATLQGACPDRSVDLQAIFFEATKR